jgi:hypothetical protein
MSNWFAYYHNNQRIEPGTHKKPFVLLLIGSLVLILLGTWLIVLVLNLRGIQLLGNKGSEKNIRQTAIFHPCVEHWEKEILAWAEAYDLDPLLIATVMQIESCGDPQAVSPAGAQGLFQVMPYHFQPGEDMLDPQTNARRGLAYLYEALQKADHDFELALAGYNGGHGQIYRDPDQWPAETRRYVHWGYDIYQDALIANTEGEALSAWLRAGGRHLCEQAEINLDLR